jgi:uncharacterized protein YheU (UPF0270 family)
MPDPDYEYAYEPDPAREAASSSPAEGSVVVPYTQLAPETLRSVVEDLVTRDGTDYGAVEKTLEQKVSALLRALERGEAQLVVDLATESIGVQTKEALSQEALAQQARDSQDRKWR